MTVLFLRRARARPLNQVFGARALQLLYSEHWGQSTMKVTTYEATVRDGQVLLPADAEIPNNTRVYVVVPTDEKERVRILSPRLVHRGDVTDFEMRVEREGDDARL